MKKIVKRIIIVTIILMFTLQSTSFAVSTPDKRQGESKRIPHNGSLSLTNGWDVSDLSEITIPNKTPAQVLAEKLLGSNVSISNVKYAGSSTSAGTFATINNIIGFQDGIILSSGNVHNVIGPNSSGSITAENGLPGDADLDSLIPGYQTQDATSLEFDFVPQSDKITFRYVFASDEYNEYVNSNFNDVFGFFLNGVNVAKLPNTDTAVSINNVNNGNPIGTDASNPLYYINNDINSGSPINTEMDGLTVVLSVYASVNANQVNHIKLAIADAGDQRFDSNVFIKAESFKDTTNHPPVANDDSFVADAAAPATLDVLANDSDPDNDPFMITQVTQGANGAVSINQNGNNLKYIPNTGFAGIDTFKYTITDSKGGTATANVVITIKPQTALLGDVNGDGVVDFYDALKILKYDSGLETLTPEQISLANVNKDGVVNIFDVIRILKYDAKLIPSL